MFAKRLLFIISIILFANLPVFSQVQFIYSKEGRPMLNRKNMVLNCLMRMNTDRSNVSAVAICECQVSKMDRKFTKKQFQNATIKEGIDISVLVDSDPELKQHIEECYKSSNQTILLSAQGYAAEMVKKCKENILSNNYKNIDTNKVGNFCRCQVDMIKNNKFSDDEMDAINDPNSLLYYQVMYNCGDPFATDSIQTKWTSSSTKDIKGPASDTIKMLLLNGMHFLRMKMGSVVYFWLLDTGATDMLITKDMEEKLKNEKVLSPANFIGIGNYEMANGEIDTCRKYKIAGLQIGHYSIDNIIIAVSDKAKKVIAGKVFLNKFSIWTIDNKSDILILNK
ncbi:MAG: retroviral-like aspartic protease family protein [Ginsengibacter sp.]